MESCGARTLRVRYAVVPLDCRCGWRALLRYFHCARVHESYAHARKAPVFVKSLVQRRWSK